jgi:predicted ATPase
VAQSHYLIGANAAGKSNAIAALRLLSWLAQGQKLSSIQYAVNRIAGAGSYEVQTTQADPTQESG